MPSTDSTTTRIPAKPSESLPLHRRHASVISDNLRRIEAALPLAPLAGSPPQTEAMRGSAPGAHRPPVHTIARPHAALAEHATKIEQLVDELVPHKATLHDAALEDETLVHLDQVRQAARS